MEEYLSVSEYARLYHKDPGNIRRNLAAGRLRGIKVGTQWVIPADAPYPADLRTKSGKYRNWRSRVSFNSHKALVKTIHRMIEDLRSMYGDMLCAVAVYGSYARGTQTEESDVDIALFINGTLSPRQKDDLIACVSAYELECGKILSVIDIDLHTYNQRKSYLPFYKSIEKEAIVLWTAA